MGQPWVELVEGGDYGGPSQDGPGPRCGCHGNLKVTLFTVISYSPLGDCAVSHIPLYEGNVNSKSRVVYDEVPNPCYNEYICYISPLLCLRGQELQQ